MSILKNPIKSDFTQIPNEFINQRGISPTARAAYVYLCSKPDSWVIVHSDVCNAIEVSEKTLRNAINELVNLGWLSRKKRRDGKFDYTICITPANGKKEQQANLGNRQNLPSAEVSNRQNLPPAQQANLGNRQNFPTSNTIEINNIDNNKVSNTDFLKTAREQFDAITATTQNLNTEEKNALFELINFKGVSDVIVMRSLIKQALKFKLDRPTNSNIVIEAVDLCISTNDRNARFCLPHLVFNKQQYPSPAHCNSQDFSEAF